MDSKPKRSLAERNINPVADIAKPEDFQPTIDQIKSLQLVRERVDATAPSSHAAATSLSVFSAYNSINYASNEQMLEEGTTPDGAKAHLEKAFDTIKKMQAKNSNLNGFSRVDIALALAEQKKTGRLFDLILKLFSVTKKTNSGNSRHYLITQEAADLSVGYYNKSMTYQTSSG